MGTADPLPRLLDHAQTLLSPVTEQVGAWREHAPPFAETESNILINVFFARSTRTYEAIVRHLGDVGFAEQGAMLNRSLFEDMVDARWVSLNPDLAATRLRQHFRASEDLRLAVARDFPEFFGTDLDAFELDPPMTDDERNELARAFGRYGQGSWTGLTLHSRFEQVAGTWVEGLERRQAEFFFRWLHRLNNETLHPSAHSLGRLGAPRRFEHELHFRLGSTEDLLEEVLFFAFWTYSQTARLLFETFGLTGWHKLYTAFAVPGLAAFADASNARRNAAERD
jgi:hypothetical protein